MGEDSITTTALGYSVIMNAYCKAQDLNGIKWIMDRVIALRLRPTTGIFSALTALKERYLLESDENQATYVKIMVLRLRTHASNMEQDARKKAEFLVDFIRGTVGIYKKGVGLARTGLVVSVYSGRFTLP